MKAIFDLVSFRCSRITTKAYSTSFSLGIRCLKKELRNPIYAIYGFVRLADEIVDSFQGYDQSSLFSRFREETERAIHEKISLNPVLNSFQSVVHQYHIDREWIAKFLDSMEMDLSRKEHDWLSFHSYLSGSAEAVGLMCLTVFCQGDRAMYERLKPYAMRLGSAFQKVNFLRDIGTDHSILGRTYFPDFSLGHGQRKRKEIEKSISDDFSEAFKGICQLPPSSRLGVYVAYVYYRTLFRKLRRATWNSVLSGRIRINNGKKATLLACSYIKYQLKMIQWKK